MAGRTDWTAVLRPLTACSVCSLLAIADHWAMRLSQLPGHLYARQSHTLIPDEMQGMINEVLIAYLQGCHLEDVLCRELVLVAVASQQAVCNTDEGGAPINMMKSKFVECVLAPCIMRSMSSAR